MRSTIPYKCNNSLYENYYLQQSGHGIPVFKGHRGYGLGNILGGLFRVATPLLKKGGKALLKEGAKTGLGVMSDILAGQSIKTAAKNRSRQAGQRLLNKISSKAETARKGAEARRIKRRRTTQISQKPNGRKRSKKPKYSDIFSS
ncbi:Gypsy retrotransposon integrase 1 [Elysia marginata]|uniref:Gypsy retrotransposon integrase 1 n=1 Tax=Elysia marginata TaxID=1093978 RepID=A0AAV4EKD6_9GAST|nr:Gypsy retrotransposon integrase 1 [Elysia marginata]